MKRYLTGLAILLACVCARATDCIPSGVTDQYTYFVAVDSTDFTTRETGLSSFTVYRSRNGAAAAAFTTPTVNETSSANMPGVYELLLDEDMTLDSGDDVQHMTVHITATGMAPVTKEFCISRPKITAGNTLAVASDGDVSGNVDGTVASVVGDIGGIAPNGLTLDAFNTDTNPLFGITRRGTAQAATATTLQIDSGASFGDDTVNGQTLMACGSTQGYCQSRAATDYVGSTDTATVDTWTVTPSGTITFFQYGTAPASGSGSAPTTGDIVAAIAAADIDANDNTAGSWGQRLSRIPNVAPGASGGLPTTDSSNRVTALISSGTGSGQLSISSGLLAWNAAWDAEVQSEAADAINADTGDSFTAVPYNSAWSASIRSALGLSSANLDTQLSGLSSAAAAIDAIVDQLLIGVNVEQINGVTVLGAGTAASPWNGE